MQPEPDTREDQLMDEVFQYNYHHGLVVDLPWLQRESSEQRPCASSLKKSLDFMNHSTSWTYTFRQEVVTAACLIYSWCNSSCFWPLTWTIPIQPTPAALVFLHLEPSNCYEEVSACSTFTCINWHIPLVLHLPNARDVYKRKLGGM